MKKIVRLCLAGLTGVLFGFTLGTIISAFLDIAIASFPTGQPSWYEHVDLMQVIIVVLLFIISGFIKRDLYRFENKLTGVCEAITQKADLDEVKKKADEQKNTSEHIDLWRRINHHKHLESTGEVVIVEK
jgi:hypothetical protein